MAAEHSTSDGLIVEIDAIELTLGRLDQLTHDVASLVREVANEVAGRDGVRWVIDEIRRESPLRLAISPQPTRDEIPHQLVSRLASIIAEGIAVIEDRPERPEHFNDAALDRAKDLAGRVGEDVAAVRFQSRNGHLSQSVRVSKRLAANVDELVGPRLERFGTVEGRLEGVLTHKRHVFYIWEALTGRRVECVFADRIPLEQVLAAYGHRVSVRGLIRTRKTGEKLSVEAQELYEFPPEEELPTIAEIEGILRDVG